MKKGLTIFLIIILAIFAISLSFILYLGLNNNWNYNFNIGLNKNISDKLIFEKDYNIKEISLKTNYAKIEIKENDTNNITLKIYSDDLDRFIINENEKLEIKDINEPCKFFCFNQKLSHIIITIPKDYNQDLTINNKYGDIYINNLPNLNVIINENAGDINIDSINNGIINNDLGDIIINSINDGTINCSAGDIKIKNINNATINNNFGDIKVNNITNSFTIKNNAGDIYIDNINITKNSQINNDLGDIKINSTNEINIISHTDLGNNKINHNYPESNITLNIENNCGNIKVNN